MITRLNLISALFVVTVAVSGCETISDSNDSSDVSQWSDAQRADVHVKLGIGYLQRGQLQVARTEIEKALSVKPNYAPAHHAMGLLQQKLRNDKLALHHLREAVRLDPEDFLAQNDYGLALCRRGRIDEGITELGRALSNPLNTRPDLSSLAAGQCQIQNKQWLESKTYLERALKLNPSLRTALYHLVGANYSLGEYLSARAYLERYLQGGGATPSLLLLAVKIEQNLGDEDAARVYAKQLISRFPSARESQQIGAILTRS